MVSPTSPRQRHDRPMAIRTCPESGNPAAPSTFWTLRRISNPVTYHFSLGPRRLWTNAQTARIRAKRRALDEIAARQRAADEKHQQELKRLQQAAMVSPSVVVQ